MRRPELQFKWIGLEPPEDELRRAQIDQVYLTMGVYSPAYVQERLGVPVEFRDTSQHGDISQLVPFLQRAIKADLADWRERARREFKRGQRFSVFYSQIIPSNLYSRIVKELEKAESLEDIDNSFEKAKNYLQDTQYLLKSLLPVQEVGEEQPFRYP